MLMPRSEVIQNIFPISVNQQNVGSCFAYAAKGFLYLITAQHIVKDMGKTKKNPLHIYKDNKWLTIEVIPYFVEKVAGIDIAVLRTFLPVSEDYSKNIELTGTNVVLGQDVYFLGFPYFGQVIKHPAQEINRGFPLPFIKKATFCALQPPVIYFDGHNNPGFSGGPIGYWNQATQKSKIIGIVSGYVTQQGRIETSTDMFYRENSGIGVGYSIEHARDLIEQISEAST